jgi:hypothetical protein
MCYETEENGKVILCDSRENIIRQAEQTEFYNFEKVYNLKDIESVLTLFTGFPTYF